MTPASSPWCSSCGMVAPLRGSGALDLLPRRPNGGRDAIAEQPGEAGVVADGASDVHRPAAAGGADVELDVTAQEGPRPLRDAHDAVVGDPDGRADQGRGDEGIGREADPE